MAEAVAIYRVYDLPWTVNAEQERRFKRLSATCTFGLLAFVLLLWFLPVPKQDPAAVQEIPKRLARLVVEQRPPPPPPPVVRELPPEPEPVVQEPEPVEQRVVEPEPVPEPVVAETPPPPPVDTTQQARARARAAGLLPFAEQLSSLRDNQAAGRLEQTGAVRAGAGDAPAVERSLITSSRVGAGSGGINTAALSRNTGGSGLDGRATTQVASPVETLAPAGGEVERSGVSDKPPRSREEIERVFDKNKGAIYALYNRALRQNAGLQGKVVLRLTIAPDGTVTACEIVSSELGDPDLEQKLVQRVMLFQFEARDVEAVTTTKPIDFFPA